MFMLKSQGTAKVMRIHGFIQHGYGNSFGDISLKTITTVSTQLYSKEVVEQV